MFYHLSSDSENLQQLVLNDLIRDLKIKKEDYLSLAVALILDCHLIASLVEFFLLLISNILVAFPAQKYRKTN